MNRLCRAAGVGVLICLLYLLPTTSAEAACGGDGQSICTTAKATKSSGQPICPSGSALNLNLECYACPAGHKRTVNPDPIANSACVKPSSKKFKKPRYTGRTYCAANHFIGPIATGKCRQWECRDGFEHWSTGNCYSCDGLKRNANAIDSAKGCDGTVPASYSTTIGKGRPGCRSGSFFDAADKGSCWSCPAGYNRNLNSVKDAAACTAQLSCATNHIEVRGKCYKKDQCGLVNQRPCLLVEHIPSCKNNLTESIRDNKCVGSGGNLPFFTTLGEMVDIAVKEGKKAQQKCVADGNRNAHRAQTTGLLNTSAFNTVGTQRLKYVGVGFGCATPRILDTLDVLRDIDPRIWKSIEQAFDQKFNSKTCVAATDSAGRVSCAVGLMPVGDMMSDTVCTVKAFQAQPYISGSPSSPSSPKTIDAYNKMGEGIFMLMQWGLEQFVIAKLAKPLKANFKKEYVEKKRSPTLKRARSRTTGRSSEKPTRSL